MFNRITLQNFQSHRKTILDLHKNVNAIIGKSNSGKTAILRGLFWAINNRPLGASFISYWNRDANAKPIKPTYIEIETKGFDYSFKVRRIKSKDINGYIVDENKKDALEAIGTDVPEQISNIFNISEVNIQRQMDAPFLLSESAADVARFFNKEIRLDLIDHILGNAESERRKLNKDIKTLEESIADLIDKQKEYAIVSNAQRLNGELQTVEKKLEKISTVRDNIFAFKVEHNKYTSILKNYSSIDFSDIERLMESAISIDSKKKKIQSKYEAISGLYYEFVNADEDIANQDSIIEDMEKQLDGIACPICGKKMELQHAGSH